MVGSETVRRLTEAAGTAAVTIATAAVDRLEQTLPEPPAGPPVQHLSVDGAMVPLVGGVWAEVKTLAVGTVTSLAEAPVTRQLSYFSCLADAATFGRLATGETHRRGTVTAGTVVAVNDGAEWCQGFVDLHRPDAVRVLDFPHAVGYLGQAAQAAFGPGTAAASAWLGEHARALRYGEPDTVLGALTALAERADLTPEACLVLTQALAYLTARREQIRYATFAAAGYPIGSGSVESANKLVVEARLKGAGMHWARASVNPMLSLRTLLANDRWDEAWPGLWRELRRQAPDRAATRRGVQRTATIPAGPPPPPPVLISPLPAPLAPPGRLKTIVNGKPTPDHPWRRSALFPAKS